MKKSDVLDLFKIEDMADLPGAVMATLESPERDAVYLDLINLNNADMSYDWFQSIYEDELAQRSQNKQDFTPNSVGRIASMLTGNPKGTIYEPTAGNGGMIISDWWHRCLSSDFPLMHFPADHMVECWELSGRAIPILLLNLSIRGIMGCVYHGDVLERSIKAKYILLNRSNDTLAFSEIIRDDTLNLTIAEI